MKNDFDYKAAYKLEEELREKGDIPGLLQISMEFWENLGSIHTFEYRFPRICYYYGRLKDENGLRSFFEDNSSNFILFLNNELKQISQKLFEFGYKFPNLNDSDLSELESYYCNPKHYELIEELLFDKDKLYRPLKSYVSENTKSGDKETIVNEVKEAYLKNLYLPDYDDLMWFYNRTLNKVEQMDYQSSAEFIHYPILDFIDYSKLLEYSKELINEDFHSYYYNHLLEKGLEADMIPHYHFKSSGFDDFKEVLTNYFNEEREDLLDKILEKGSLDWLNEF